MALTDVREAHASSLYDTDKVIGVFEGSFTAAAMTGSQPEFTYDLQDTPFGDTCLTQCIYRIDGGEWHDDGIFHDEPDIQVASLSRGSQVGVVAASIELTTHTVEYKLVAFAKEGQGDIQPVAVGTPDAYDFINNNFLKIQ